MQTHSGFVNDPCKTSVTTTAAQLNNFKRDSSLKMKLSVFTGCMVDCVQDLQNAIWCFNVHSLDGVCLLTLCTDVRMVLNLCSPFLAKRRIRMLERR